MRTDPGDDHGMVFLRREAQTVIAPGAMEAIGRKPLIDQRLYSQGGLLRR